MALDADKFADVLLASVDGGFPSGASILSSKIKTYLESNGTPVIGVKVVLGPCTGAGWLTMAAGATGDGIGDLIIQTAVATELTASMTTIVTPTGPVVKPSTFNTSAKVSGLKDCTTAEECWKKIAQAIIDYVSPELV